MNFISRKYNIFPTKNQSRIIYRLLYNKSYYEFYNIHNIFFLDEYHEYIRIPQLGDIRIYDYYPRDKIEFNIIRMRLYRNNDLNSILYGGGEYYLMIDYILSKDNTIAIEILTNVYRKDKRDITLGDIDKIYNQGITDLEKDIDKVKKKMERLSTHSKFYWKMQKQLSKKEMKLMNAKMNQMSDIIKCEEDSKQQNIFGITANTTSSNSSTFIDTILNNQKNKINIQKQKIDIVWIDKNRKYRNLDKKKE